MVHPWRPAIIAGLIAVTGSVTTHPVNAGQTGKNNYNIVVHADSAQSQADEQEVRDAIAQIRNGKVQEAIDGPLADVITRYEKAYGKSNDAVFSARGPAQGMMYMTEAATKFLAGVSGNTSGKAIDVGPAWGMAYWARGYGYGELKRYADAEVELKKALALSPMDAQYASELAYVYQVERRFTESLALFQKSNEFLDTMDGWEDPIKTEFRCRSFRSQGYDLVELNRLDEAEKAYKSCIALVPNEPKSLGELEYVKGLRVKNQSTGVP